MTEPLRPEIGTGDFQTAAQEQPVQIPLAFRDDDVFVIDLTIEEINPED